ncbi:GTPase HflX [Stetteria hydrogenophila]
MAGAAYLVIPRRDEGDLEEAIALAETAGYRITRIWKTRYLNRLGRGLIEEIARHALEERPDKIIFYGDLQPSTYFRLVKESRTPVIDRVQLILEIFARHAGSREAKLQIEMARIRHEIPLVREWIRRSKMRELPGFLGPGGYAIDAYYRHLTSRLARLRRELEALRRIRRVRLESRRAAGLKHVSIVGYASAGKTTLFNRLTGLSKPVGPEYFTTLHPKHASITLKGERVVVSDTVGFIRRVPPEVIEAFYSTLEEIAYSDAVVFVVDVSEEPSRVREKMLSGFETLARIGAVGMPVIVAANKIDASTPLLAESLRVAEEVAAEHADGSVVPISARRGVNIDLLLEELARALGVTGGAGGGPLREGVRAKTGAQAWEG